MKRNFLLLIVALLMAGAQAYAQSETQPPTPAPAPASAADAGKSLSEVLAFMSGNWEGNGISRGEHEFIGKMAVSTELEGNALLVRRESMNKDGGPSGGLQELMVIGYDGTTKKIIGTVYDNKNNIGIYVGESKEGEVTFSLATAPPGSTYRRTLKLMPDGTLSFVMESGAAGKEVSKVVEINFKKKM